MYCGVLLGYTWLRGNAIRITYSVCCVCFVCVCVVCVCVCGVCVCMCVYVCGVCVCVCVLALNHQHKLYSKWQLVGIGSNSTVADDTAAVVR